MVEASQPNPSDPVDHPVLSLRQSVAFYLNDVTTPIGRGFCLTIVLLALISSAAFVAETFPIEQTWRSYLNILDISVLSVFVAEYGLRLWSAERKLSFLLSPNALIDLIVILPFFLGIADIRFVQIIRWFRILHVVRYLKDTNLFGLIHGKDGLILIRILFTLFSIIFVYSGLIYQVEHPINTDEFRTFLDAFYFSVVTMTTVGFGDLIPTSHLGRLLTVFMILTGIGLIPWQVGDLIKQLVKTSSQRLQPCPACNWQFHDPDALYCKKCGTLLEERPSEGSGT